MDFRVHRSSPLLIAGLAFALGTGALLGQTAPDIAQAIPSPPPNLTGVDTEFGQLLTRLRAFAVVLLVLSTVAAAIAASMFGKRALAVYIAAGATILFGGFWVYSVLRDPFSGGSTLQAITDSSRMTALAGRYQNTAAMADGASSGLKFATAVKLVTDWALTILASAIAPFLVIYGAWLAVGIATKSENMPSWFNYIVGSSVCLGAALIAQVFISVIPK